MGINHGTCLTYQNTEAKVKVVVENNRKHGGER